MLGTDFAASRLSAEGHAQPESQPTSEVAPTDVEQTALIAGIRENALSYPRTLPNLLCSQLTRRYSGSQGSDAQVRGWKLADTLTLELSYLEGHECYQIVKVNGLPSPESFNAAKGHLNPGDFGGLPRAVFAPKSSASFRWLRWETLNGRRTAVVSFTIDLTHTPFRSRGVAWAAKGLVYAEATSQRLLRIAIEAVDLHGESKDHTQVHDYGYETIGSRQYLLPTRSSELLNYADGSVTKIESQFSGYRLFPAETAVAAANPASETPAKMEGRWLSDGYGMFLEIQSGTMRGFDITSISCTPAFTLEPSEAKTHMTVEDSGTTARLIFGGGAASTIMLRRTGERPKTYGKPFLDTPQNNYAVFWQTFAENYAFFDLRHIDWAAQDRRYRAQVSSATSPQALFKILRHLIEPLHDGHTSIVAENIHQDFGGDRPNPHHQDDVGYRRYSQIIASNYIKGEFASYCRGNIWFGFLDGSIGYLAINGLEDYSDEGGFETSRRFLDEALDQIFRDSGKLTGLVIDLRHNPGGYDQISLAIASRLTDLKYFAYSKETRDNVTGPLHFSPKQLVWVTPSDRPGYHGRAVLLTSMDCASAGETLIMALLGRQPAIVRVGEPTQGVFSDILERQLPNGWNFGLSNEVYRTIDGRSFEGAGVPPDILVPVFTPMDRQNHRDPGIERALEILHGSVQR